MKRTYPLWPVSKKAFLRRGRRPATRRYTFEALEARRLLALDAIDDPSTLNAYAVDKSQILNVAAASGVLVNDVGSPLSITSFTATSTNGAAVGVNADGSFTYNPTGSATLQAMSAGSTLTDTFTYTISNSSGGIPTAATISVSSAAPNVNDVDVAALNTTGAATDKMWTDTTNPGQTFTTGGNTLGYELNSFTLQTSTFSPGVKTFSIRVGTVSGSSFTTIANITGVKQNDDMAAGSYMTLTFNKPVSLLPNTVYGVDIEMTGSTTAWQSGIPYLYYRNSNLYTAGARYTRADGNPATITLSAGSDRVFHLDMAEVSSDTATVSVAVSAPQLAATANDDPSYSVDKNQILTVTAPGVLANDVGPSLIVVAYDATSVNGAAVTVNPNGSFTYNPTGSSTIQALGSGNSLTDTFTYSIATQGSLYTTAKLVAHYPLNDGIAGQALATGTGNGAQDLIDDPSHPAVDATVDGTGGQWANDPTRGIVYSTGENDRLNLGTQGIDRNVGFTWSLWVNVASSNIADTGADSIIGTRVATGGQWNKIDIQSIGSWAGISGYNLADDTWHHVAYVGDTTSVRLYIDGVLRGTDTSTPTATFTGKFELGGTSNFSEDITGLLSDLSVWNGALSASAIAALASGASPYDLLPDSATVSVNVTATNANPTLIANAGTVTINEGQIASNTGTYNDTNSGDNVAISTSPLGSVSKTGTNSGNWNWSYHTTENIAPQTITITANDGNGGSANTQFNLIVNNVAPTVTLNPVAAINEAGSATVTGSYTDPGIGDSHTVVVNWGDPNNATNSTFVLPAINTLTVNQTVASGADSAVLTVTSVNLTTGQVGFSVGAHAYADDGASPGNGATTDISTITVTVTDDDAGAGANTTTLTVRNVPPSFELGLSQTLPLNVNLFSHGTISFTDPGADVWTATVDYDLADSSPAVPLTLTGKTFRLANQYIAAGIYTIRVTITDDDGNSFSDTMQVSVQAPTQVYVDDDWASFNQGVTIPNPNPVTAGEPAAVFGFNAFALPNTGINAVAASGTVIVNAGVYAQAVNINQQLAMVLQTGFASETASSFGSLDVSVTNATISLNGIALTTGGNNGTTQVESAISGTGNLIKIGAGTLLLSGANTYTGPTQVNAGALGGGGSLTSNITVANLATLSPGGTPGTLTTTGNTTLQTGSIYRVELIGLTHDRLVTNGVELTNAVLDASSDSNLGAGTPFIIIDNTSANAVLGTFAGLPENASFFINGYQYFITYVYNGNDVAIIRNQMVDAIDDQFGPILVNTSFTGNTYTNDSDPDGDARSTVIAQPLNGKVFMDPATGQFTYTPKPNFIGTDSFTYRLSDGEFNDTAIVEILVAPLLVDGNGVLQVGGTTGGDNILVQAGSIRYNNTTYPLSASRVVVHGGGGNDTISVTASNIAVEFYGDEGDDYLSGGSLNDILDGGAGTDRLLGNAGDDRMYGGGGSDNLSGGVGNDYLSGDGYLNASSVELQAADAGKDTLSGDAGDDEIHGGAGMDTLLGGIGNDYLSGGEDGDAVDGGAGHDILLGGGGGDKLYGRAGNDVLIGGAGLDTLLGDTGLDLIYGGDVNSALDETTLRAIALQWFTPATQTAAVNQLLGYKQDDLVSDTLNGEADDDWYLIYAKDLIATTERFPGNRKTQW